MKKLLLLCIVFFIGCFEKSEGRKFGILQKVSHKTSLQDYYVIEVAYVGGRSNTSSDGKGGFNETYANTQEILIDSIAYDTLGIYVGDQVVFTYKDNGLVKHLTSIKTKQ